MIKKIVTIILIIMTIINTIAPTKIVLADEDVYTDMGIITYDQINYLIDERNT